jgi:TPR repeat protein
LISTTLRIGKDDDVETHRLPKLAADLSNRHGIVIRGHMKTIAPTLFAFLLAAFAAPLAAQSFEEQMRTAAGAYERKDMATAVRIWKEWAAKGDAEAQTLLGAMYWSGEGVPRDHKEAAALYLRAAQKGYARAQNNIGFMLAFGEGVPPRDDVEAYKWLSLAIQGYTSKNQDRLEQAKKDLAMLAARMDRAQIAEAEKRAKAWKPVP